MTGQKTVFILGAGFSVKAGAPSQEKLVGEIFRMHNRDPHIFESQKIEDFKLFLTNTLNVPENLHSEVPLEDIFTPIDRCLLDNLSFRDKSVEDLKVIRETVYYLIGKVIQKSLTSSNKDYINQFAAYLVSKCSARKKGGYKAIDSVSVLGTNWDILLDTSIMSSIDNYTLENHLDFNFRPIAVVDYCCYISSFDKDDKSVMPGLEVLGKGGFNVKYLKLHGSLNWLQCQSCQRVYVNMSNKIAIDQFLNKERCRHCEENLGNSNSHILTSNLIMPTFLKDFSNPQYKIIWQNAGVELSEATKVVFIGYSLPMADFEMRQLLARMVRVNAEIEVVDYAINPLCLNDKAKELEKRFRVFFGKRKIEFKWCGAAEYVHTLCGYDNSRVI